ncbi:hypothetical protein L208DRAFT_1410701 [Tricholoma matsutake]|nr:hypothetical protein L208DRAFT_1410701 [Tricholoma matsutake 945]
MRRPLLACFALFTLSTHGQTVTTVDGAGHTIVEVITVANGLPTTQVVQTLTSLASSLSNSNSASTTTLSTTTSSTTASSLSTVTTSLAQQGPVGQPAPTVIQPGGVTPYVYTTVVGGVTQVLSDNFTPSSPPTVLPSVGSSGSIMPYSVYLSIYGPQSTSPANSGAGKLLKVWWGEYLVIVVVGAWFGMV